MKTSSEKEKKLSLALSKLKKEEIKSYNKLLEIIKNS